MLSLYHRSPASTNEGEQVEQYVRENSLSRAGRRRADCSGAGYRIAAGKAGSAARSLPSVATTAAAS